MNDSGTVCHRNIRITHDVMCLFVLFFDNVLRAVKKRFVFFSFKFDTLFRLKDFVGFHAFLFVSELSEYLVKQRFRHIIGIAVRSFYLAVILIRVHTECNVTRQRPRCGRPCQEISILSNDFKTRDRGAFLYGLITLCHFLRGKRGSTARAVRHDLKALVQKLFVPDLF